MAFNKVEPVPEMNQLYFSCWDPKWQFSSLCPVWVRKLSKAQVLLEPNQTQVLAPGCWVWKGMVYGSTFWWDLQWLLKLHCVTQTSAAWPGMCCLLSLMWAGSDLTKLHTHVFKNSPAHPFAENRISPFPPRSLKPNHCSLGKCLIIRNMILPRKKAVCFHYPSRIKCKKQTNCINYDNYIRFLDLLSLSK